MAFWNHDTLLEKLSPGEIVEPFSEANVKSCAYELCMGPEAFVTSHEDRTKQTLDEGESFRIPPGQMALLLTEEVVAIPTDTIAFISMRFGKKSKGLINVSGFHVDPGFPGRLKFSVYNAGSQAIVLARGERVFQIFFCSLTGDSEPYDGAHANQLAITPEEETALQGEIASPGELLERVNTLDRFYLENQWLLKLIVATLLGILVRICFMSSAPDVDLAELKDELKSELRSDTEFIDDLKSTLRDDTEFKDELKKELRTEITPVEQSPINPTAPEAGNPLSSQTPAARSSTNGESNP